MSVNKQLNLLSYPYKYCLQKPEAMTSRKFTLYFDLRKEKKKSLVAQKVKNLPAMQETQVWSLGQEDHLEKEMASHSSILAWEIPWTEEPGGLQSMVLQKS